jgi:1-deoxyxylulose-5-phosphate synthase
MHDRRLGTSGLRVSAIGLGMMSFGDPSRCSWSLDEAAAEPIVRRAVDAGINFFDTADMYDLGASEEVTGRLLARLHPRREDYVLATKVYFPMGDGPNDRGLSRAHILAAVDASLRRLGVDHIDLYQIHRWDEHTPIEETIDALDAVVRAGKVRYLGASSMCAWQFAKAQHIAERAGRHRFISMQGHYNLLYREEEREMVPLCLDQGVGVIPWSPLARGRLARRLDALPTVRSGSDPLGDTLYAAAEPAIVAAVHAIATERSVAPATVALAWLLQRRSVVAPIIGATRAHHIDDAVAAVDLELTADERRRLEMPYRPCAVRGHQ